MIKDDYMIILEIVVYFIVLSWLNNQIARIIVDYSKDGEIWKALYPKQYCTVSPIIQKYLRLKHSFLPVFLKWMARINIINWIVILLCEIILLFCFSVETIYFWIIFAIIEMIEILILIVFQIIVTKKAWFIPSDSFCWKRRMGFFEAMLEPAWNNHSKTSRNSQYQSTWKSHYYIFMPYNGVSQCTMKGETWMKITVMTCNLL